MKETRVDDRLRTRLVVEVDSITKTMSRDGVNAICKHTCHVSFATKLTIPVHSSFECLNV